MGLSRVGIVIFADTSAHAHYTPYNRGFFVGLIFVISYLSMKIGLLENFPLAQYMV
jgi:hypothetical protein